MSLSFSFFRELTIQLYLAWVDFERRQSRLSLLVAKLYHFFLIPENEFPRRLRVYEYDALQYYAPSGETVQVPRFVRPYEVRQIAANAPFHEIKESFRRSANHSSRQKRAMASLAYIILASKDHGYKKTN